MVPYAELVLVISIWTLIGGIDYSLKKSRKYGPAYWEYLNNNGLTITLAHIKWQTTKWNRYFMKFGHYKGKLVTYWFCIGAVFGCGMLFLSVVLLMWMLYKAFKVSSHEQILQPVMPGMNMPWNQVCYYFITLITAGAFHEVGHAVSAARENVRINSFGVFILFLYPGAFVELHTDHLEVISPLRKLRIFTAGVWHNVVLALLAYLGLCSIPYMVLPLFHLESGVAVTWIDEKSSAARTLPIATVITKINKCSVKNIDQWFECLEFSSSNTIQGYCNTKSFVKTYNTSLPKIFVNNNEPDCCNDTSSYRFCFYYDVIKIIPSNVTPVIENTNELIRKSNEFIVSFREHACLPARTSLSGKQSCKQDTDCIETYQQMLCIKPLTSNHTRVIKISHSRGQDVLFVGNPSELISAISLSNYAPRYSFSFINLPYHLNMLFMYFISISCALAVLNMVPCFFLDGHQTLLVILEIVFPNLPRQRTNIATFILILGSSLLLVNILLALLSLVKT